MIARHRMEHQRSSTHRMRTCHSFGCRKMSPCRKGIISCSYGQGIPSRWSMILNCWCTTNLTHRQSQRVQRRCPGIMIYTPWHSPLTRQMLAIRSNCLYPRTPRQRMIYMLISWGWWGHDQWILCKEQAEQREIHLMSYEKKIFGVVDYYKYMYQHWGLRKMISLTNSGYPHYQCTVIKCS